MTRFDDDLAGESTRITNRLRDLLTRIHLPWNGTWARASSAQPCSSCSTSSVPGLRSAKPGAVAS
ncbi:hypothetical protein [Streptomyces sp. NPDC098090]|uniref:hypothetical protein n=1 Tax=Streptomyces sp. NPDC098090 TaxID=3366095 RepID=UPI003828E72C